jgi:D-alanyl-D-alanine carboxypeptidase (penicillin-binding protein 5/6)
VDTTTPLTTVPLTKCRSAEAVELYAAEPVSGYGHADDKVTYSFALPERVSATVKEGQKLGTATVYLDGYEVGQVDLVTHREYVSDFRTDIKATLLLLCALILILCALGFVTLRCGGGLTLNQRRRQMKKRR